MQFAHSSQTARRSRLLNSVARIGACIGTAGFLLLAAAGTLQNAAAEGDTRTLTFHHLHTGEDITVTFKRDGQYDEAALKKLDWFMRDWRKQETTHMDPQLFDVLWEVYREVGASKPIEVVCGYRSPATNAMLRAHSNGVAEFSQHTLGHAMDFYIPGVSLEKLREIGLRLQAGGVGFYPTSGSPFVHMDTGTIRHWPRLTYAALSRVFPDGKTVHVASDGRPLPHFAEALSEVEARGKTPNHIALEQARAHGAITEQQVQTAESTARSPQQPSLLATLFGFGRQDTGSTGSIAAAKPSRTRVASAEPSPRTLRGVPLPSARPDSSRATATSDPRGLLAMAAADALPESALLRKMFALDRATDAPIEGALAYAYAPSDDFALVRGEKWGVAAAPPPPPKPAPESQVRNEGQTTIVAKAGSVAPVTGNARQKDSPWLRAAMLTPSVSGELTVSYFGEPDMRELRGLLFKPSEAVAMGFSDEPALATEHFAGSAIGFLGKATFERALTASLQLPNTR